MVGQTLHNRYLITARIGKGAMGTVYRATDSQTGQEVAVKVIARDLTFDEEMLERFRREGEALRQLKHPNIVGFVDTFQHEGQQVIVMEYVPGGSLHDLIKRGRLPLDRARRVGLELCDALTRAHHLNIVHRDIKPENVLIDEDGTPKLTDFGVARLMSEGTRLTGTGMQVGTPYYMSPEAWEGKPLDGQADIWSLGVVLYEMLAGEVPFGGDTVVAVMNKVLTAPLPDVREARSEVPAGMAGIIERMLTREKDARYQTMRHVGADLEQGEPSQVGRITPLPGAAAATTTVVRPVRSGWQWSVVGLAVGAIGVVAVLLWGARNLFFGSQAATPTVAPTLAAQVVTQTPVPVMEVAATTGAISGEVIMSGESWQGHTFYVYLIPWGEFVPTHQTTLSAPGSYRLDGIAPGAYTLSVVLDMDNSGYGPQTPGDVIAMYGAEGEQTLVTVEAGQELAGMDITLVSVEREATLVAVANIACTPVPGVGKGSVSGSVSIDVSPVPEGPIYVNLHLPDGSPTMYTIKLEGAGPYKLGDVSDGTYMVVALVDTDGSGPTGASQNDLVGWFGGGPQSLKTVTISGGCDITDVDIVVTTPGLQQRTIPTPTPGARATATGAPAGATSGPSLTPQAGQRGSISGVVTQSATCADGKNYPIYVMLNPRDQSPGGPPGSFTVIEAPGPFTLSNVVDGDYWVSPMMYCGGRTPGPPQSGDLYGDSLFVTVSSGEAVTGISIDLHSRMP